MRSCSSRTSPSWPASSSRGCARSRSPPTSRPPARTASGWRPSSRTTSLVLDVMLPDLDGLEVCRRIRAVDDRTPVLMLTALGAVARPGRRARCGRRRLPAQAVRLRRAAGPAPRARPAGRRTEAEPCCRSATCASTWPRRRVAPRRHGRLARPARSSPCWRRWPGRPGEVLTRERLVHLAWDIAYEARSNVVDVCVKGLRDRIDRPFGRRSLQTVRGLGYRLVEDARREPAADPAPAGARRSPRRRPCC